MLNPEHDLEGATPETLARALLRPLRRPLAVDRVRERHADNGYEPDPPDSDRPRADYLLTVRGDSINRTVLCDGDIAAIHRTTTAESGQVVVARVGDEVTLKRFVRIDDRRVELRPESHNPAHEVMKLDLAKHILDIDGIAVGALIGRLHDAAAGVDANA